MCHFVPHPMHKVDIFEVQTAFPWYSLNMGDLCAFSHPPNLYQISLKLTYLELVSFRSSNLNMKLDINRNLDIIDQLGNAVGTAYKLDRN